MSPKTLPTLKFGSENKTHMKYITLNDLHNTIRSNIWKIPRDIDFIITIPRSGTICGSIISEFLNVPLIDIDSFIAGVQPYGGGRLRYYNNLHGTDKKTGKVLVVDDTVFSGKSKIEAREKLKGLGDYQFIFMAVYLEGPAYFTVDFWLEDLRKYTNGFSELVLYEWNIFHHNEDIMASCLYDLDGVICVDPPDERNTKDYEEYIANAVPLFVPTAKIGGIVTYRLKKYEDITKKWLADNNVQYDFIAMYNSMSYEERMVGMPPHEMKGLIYSKMPDKRLFVESNDKQAELIYNIAKKPVLSIETNKLYGGA